MAAHEQQDQRVVGVACSLSGLSLLHGQLPPSDGVLTTSASLLATQQVGQPTSRDHDQPALRVVRQTLARPLRRSREHGLLHRIFGSVEMAVAAYHGAENLRRQLAQQALNGNLGDGFLDQYVNSSADSMIGRMSAYALAATCSGAGVAASRPAISVARSKLSHSTIQ
jgi:hypothetical protein